MLRNNCDNTCAVPHSRYTGQHGVHRKALVTSKRHILEGHRQVGKRFIPPFLDLRFQDAKWTSDLIPNLVWVSLVYHHCGGAMGRAARLVNSLVGAAQLAHEAKTDERAYFIFAGEYSALSAAEQERTVVGLRTADTLSPLQKALEPLVASYPQCPLRFLLPPPNSASVNLADMRQATDCLFFRADPDTAMIQALAVGAMMTSGKLVIAATSALSRIASIVDYPLTEASEEVAAAIRTAILALPAALSDSTVLSAWAAMFWQRGFDIQPCE